MNEQYLTRGKRQDNGEWVTGYYAEPGCHHVILTGEIVSIDNELTWERYEIDPATLGLTVTATPGP